MGIEVGEDIHPTIDGVLDESIDGVVGHVAHRVDCCHKRRVTDTEERERESKQQVPVERNSIELGVLGMWPTCCLSVSNGFVPLFQMSNLRGEIERESKRERAREREQEREKESKRERERVETERVGREKGSRVTSESFLPRSARIQAGLPKESLADNRHRSFLR